MARKSSKKEDLDLAEEHIKIAEDIVVKAGKDSGKNENKFVDAELALERAESDVDDIEDEFDDEVEE